MCSSSYSSSAIRCAFRTFFQNCRRCHVLTWVNVHCSGGGEGVTDREGGFEKGVVTVPYVSIFSLNKILNSTGGRFGGGSRICKNGVNFL